jgi:hypothetical protein
VILKLNKPLDASSPTSKTTDTKLSKLIEETSTVDVDWENQRAVVTSEKHKTDFHIGKLRSAMFFSIKTTRGILPNTLSGKYTSLNSAIEAVLHYIRNSKETFAVRSDKLHEERQQRKHAES